MNFKLFALFSITSHSRRDRLDPQRNGFEPMLFVFQCILKLLAQFSITSHRRRDRLDRWCNDSALILLFFNAF